MGRAILLLEPTAKRFAKRGFEIGDDRSRFKFSKVFSGLRVLSWLNLSKHCQRMRDRLGEGWCAADRIERLLALFDLVMIAFFRLIVS